MRLNRAFPLAALALVACDFTEPAHPGAEAAENIAKFEAEARAKPDDRDAQLHLGAAYLGASRLFDAATALKKAAELDPADPRPRVGLSEIYDRMGYTQRAFAELSTCLQHTPSEPECLWRAGRMLVQKDPSREASERVRELFSKLLELAPDHPQAMYMKRTIAAINKDLGPPSSAPSSQPSAEPSAPEEPDSRPDPSIAAHEGVEGASEDVGDLNPFGMAIAKAMAAAQRQDRAGAEAGFREALKIRPQDAVALAGLAEALFVQGKTDEAVEHATKAYESDPHEGLAQWVFGMIMIKSKRDPKRGIDAWRALAKEHPDYAKQLGVTSMLNDLDRLGTERPHGSSPTTP